MKFPKWLERYLARIPSSFKLPCLGEHMDAKLQNSFRKEIAIAFMHILVSH